MMIGRKILCVCLVTFLFSYWAAAQSYDLLDVTCIDIDGKELLNPTAGGLNSPQFNLVDFDLDGVDDLVILDRDGEIVLPFRYVNEEYVYAPQFRNRFPRLKKWARFIDIDKDGIKDIFCYNLEAPIDGVEIYFGKVEDAQLSYDKYADTTGFYEIIYYWLGSDFYNMEISSADLPDMADVDGDGDVDILSFDGDNPFVKFYKNLCVEEGIPLNEPKFTLADGCWGKFRENGINEKITLSSSVTECAPAIKSDEDVNKNNVHAGSTITVYDDDGDGDYEAIIGDLSNVHMNWLFNSSVDGEAFMTEQDTLFPFYDTPIDIYIYNAAFVLDIDRDGNDDLIAAPNFTGAIENRNNVWFYKNTASSGQHDFQLQTKNFLGNEMFDFGSLSSPTTCDFNQDGKIDLLVGVFGEFVAGENPDSRMYLFENVSDGSGLKYELVDEDYLGLLAYKSLFFNYAPCFGDLDSDGDDDLMVSTNTGELIYLENIAGAGNPYQFAAPVFEYANIDVGDNAKVQMVDLNRDGLMDLVIGERNQNADPQDSEKQGNINYFENQGTASEPSFNEDEEILPNTPALGHVVTKDITTIKGSAAPFFYDTGTEFLLYTGSESGKVQRYKDIEGNFYSGFTQVTDEVTGLQVGKRSAICVDDLNGDGLLEFILGNIRGGITIYGSNLGADGIVATEQIVEKAFQVYPNPATDKLLIETGDIPFKFYEIFSIDGSLVLSGVIEGSSKTIDISSLNEGLFGLTLRGDEVISSKVINVLR